MFKKCNGTGETVVCCGNTRCDQILDGVESLRDQCFGEVTVDSVAVMLSFREAIARSKRSPEKLFVLLHMYEIMRELQPEKPTLYRDERFCAESDKRLAQTAQETFADFEEAVKKDATKTAVMDGTVHPLTSYVIKYVRFDYQSKLRLLFQEFDCKDSDTELGAVTTRIMHALQNNLDGKSKQYKRCIINSAFPNEQCSLHCEICQEVRSYAMACALILTEPKPKT